MLIFNMVLLLHFIAFLLFLFLLAIIFPKQEKQLHAKSIFVGAIILITGILLVVIKYPQINLYKIIPKSLLFIAIATFCGLYSGKIIPPKVYYAIVTMTVIASLIAVVKL